MRFDAYFSVRIGKGIFLRVSYLECAKFYR